MTKPQRKRRAAAALMAVTLAAGQLAGCANQGGNVQLVVDPADPCGQQRAALGEARTHFQDEIVAGAVQGGVMGAVGGALLGGLTGGGRGAIQGALLGGATGALVGGTSAYYKAKAEQYHDQITLARSMNADLQTESTEMDHVNASFARLRSCRFRVARDIKIQMRAGQVQRDAAIQTLEYQHRMFDQEIQVARSYGVNMEKRDNEYIAAANDLARNDPSYAASSGGTAAASTATATTTTSSTHHTTAKPAASSGTQQVLTNATETIPEKRKAFVSSVDDAAKSSQVAFNVDSPAQGGPT
jgi:outer membrane lipoprotein SlyB